MWKIVIRDLASGREWEESFSSYEAYRKRRIKLSYSKRLMVISTEYHDD